MNTLPTYPTYSKYEVVGISYDKAEVGLVLDIIPNKELGGVLYKVEVWVPGRRQDGNVRFLDAQFLLKKSVK